MRRDHQRGVRGPTPTAMTAATRRASPTALPDAPQGAGRCRHPSRARCRGRRQRAPATASPQRRRAQPARRGGPRHRDPRVRARRRLPRRPSPAGRCPARAARRHRPARHSWGSSRPPRAHRPTYRRCHRHRCTARAVSEGSRRALAGSSAQDPTTTSSRSRGVRHASRRHRQVGARRGHCAPCRHRRKPCGPWP